jgi:ketopantoate reductase
MQVNIMDWLWQHHAVNAGLIGMALYAGGIEELLSDEVLGLFMVYAVRDALKVLEVRGVDPCRLRDAKPYLEPDAADFLKGYADSVLNTPYGQRVIHAGHFRGNPLEMKKFYLDVVATGEELGVDMPHLQAMKRKISTL